ncbi:hypothetical protein IIE45_004583 [Salmonella enterica]|nr:hypothetical protein [Salmonella enterica]
MRWAIKHKSGRTLFVTSDEFIANNRRKMGWIVEEVKMTSRERFEEEMGDKYEWFSEAIACADFCGDDDDGYYVGGDYIYHGTSCSEALFWLWRGWQVSREAIEIELPEEESLGCHAIYYAEDVVDAIENAGLKVKK